MKSIFFFIALLPLLTTSCSQTNRNPLLLIHLVDVSRSALDNEDFTKAVHRTCHSMATEAVQGDMFISIAVDAELSSATDPKTIKSRDELHKDCNRENKQNSQKQGTMSCLAWKRTVQLIRRLDDAKYHPVVVSQIQANERDAQCDSTVLNLAKAVAERKGRLIIANSTNQGNTGYNSWLWGLVSKTDSLENVKFFSGENHVDIAKSVSSEIDAVRNLQHSQAITSINRRQEKDEI